MLNANDIALPRMPQWEMLGTKEVLCRRAERFPCCIISFSFPSFLSVLCWAFFLWFKAFFDIRHSFGPCAFWSTFKKAIYIHISFFLYILLYQAYDPLSPSFIWLVNILIFFLVCHSSFIIETSRFYVNQWHVFWNLLSIYKLSYCNALLSSLSPSCSLALHPIATLAIGCLLYISNTPCWMICNAAQDSNSTILRHYIVT